MGGWKLGLFHPIVQSWSCQRSRYSQKDSTLQIPGSSWGAATAPCSPTVPGKREEKANPWSKPAPKTPAVCPKAQDHFPKDPLGFSSGGFGSFVRNSSSQGMSKPLSVVPAFSGDKSELFFFLLRIHWGSPSTILWGTSLSERFSQGKEEKKKKRKRKGKKEMDKKMKRRKRVLCSNKDKLGISSFLINTSRQQESAEDSRGWKELEKSGTPPVQTLSRCSDHEQREAHQGWKGKTSVKAPISQQNWNPSEMPGPGWPLGSGTQKWLIFIYSFPLTGVIFSSWEPKATALL